MTVMEGTTRLAPYLTAKESAIGTCICEVEQLLNSRLLPGMGGNGAWRL